MEAMSLAELRSWNAIAVYCGSKTGALPVYAEVAGALGRTLAERSLTLVYGGGSVGLMGVVADATMAAGGEVLGVITDARMKKTYDMMVAMKLLDPKVDLKRTYTTEFVKAIKVLP